MALQTADVTNLKCILFGAYVQRIDVDNYAIKWNNTLIDDTITKGQFLLDLYNISTTVCKELECAILAYNETKLTYCLECDAPCERDVITENI